MRLLLALLLTTVMPSFASAQTASSAGDANVDLPALAQPVISQPLDWRLSIPRGNDNSQSSAFTLPLWSTPDGRLLTMVAAVTNHGAPVAPQSPQIGSALDWRLVDVTSLFTGGLAFKVSDSASAYTAFHRGILLAPALNGTGCNALVANSDSEGCTFPLAAANTGATIGAHFGDAGSSTELDVNYGLSWLHVNDGAAFARQPWNLFAGIGDESLPTLLLPGYVGADAQNAGVNALGRWHLDASQSLDVGAALSRIQYDVPGMPLLPAFNQAALSLGVHRGDFSGQIVGRVLGPVDALNGGQRWSSIDLGISWRAPWRGVFSVGAQNLWSSGSLPLLNEPAAREVDPSQARVPYVQYHQDL